MWYAGYLIKQATQPGMLSSLLTHGALGAGLGGALAGGRALISDDKDKLKEILKGMFAGTIGGLGVGMFHRFSSGHSVPSPTPSSVRSTSSNISSVRIPEQGMRYMKRMLGAIGPK